MFLNIIFSYSSFNYTDYVFHVKGLLKIIEENKDLDYVSIVTSNLSVIDMARCLLIEKVISKLHISYSQNIYIVDQYGNYNELPPYEIEKKYVESRLKSLTK